MLLIPFTRRLYLDFNWVKTFQNKITFPPELLGYSFTRGLPRSLSDIASKCGHNLRKRQLHFFLRRRHDFRHLTDLDKANVTLLELYAMTETVCVETQSRFVLWDEQGKFVVHSDWTSSFTIRFSGVFVVHLAITLD